jgi:hypothetical protein
MADSRRQYIASMLTVGAVGITGCGTEKAKNEKSPSSDNALQQHATKLPIELESVTRDFGESVATSSDGTTTIISDSGQEYDTGIVYAFEQSANDWTHQGDLIIKKGEQGDNLGESVSISDDGSTAIVGAPLIDGADEHPEASGGAAYVFKRANNEWNQQVKLSNDNSDRDDLFGIPVAVSSNGSTVIIGAPAEDNTNGDSAGSSYVFQRSNRKWNQQVKLTASDGETEDRFGTSLAVSGNGSTVIVGAPGKNNPNKNISGTAYVFQRSDSNWIQKTKLTAEGDDDLRLYGNSVSLSEDGNTAIVGANPHGDSTENLAGIVYIFRQSNKRWEQQDKLTPESMNDGSLESISISNDASTAVIGAPNGTPEGGEGSVFLFERSDEEWILQTTLIPADSETEVVFGRSVTLSGDGATTIIGAPSGAPPEQGGRGSVFFYQ